MMPGKPTLFGLVKGTPVFGIPGYPVSTVIAFKTFIEPAYEKLTRSAIPRRSIACVTPYKLPSAVGMEEVVRVSLIERHGLFYAYPLARGASLFTSMTQADGLIRIPQNVEGYLEGEQVVCELLRERRELQEDFTSSAVTTSLSMLCATLSRKVTRIWTSFRRTSVA